VIPADSTGVGPKVLKWLYDSRGSQYDNSTQTNANWVTPPIAGGHPRRNDLIRIDGNIANNVSAYFRWIQDTDTRIHHNLMSTFDVSPIAESAPGTGYVGNVTWTINSTTVNELTVGKDKGAENWNFQNPSAISSTAAGAALPLSYPIAFSNASGMQDLMPVLLFASGGGGPPGASASTSCTSTPCNAPSFDPFIWDYNSAQNFWTVSDNLSKTIQAHNLKVGFYFEKQQKYQPDSQYYQGDYNFATSTAPNPSQYDAGDGYANLFEGGFASFSQANARLTGDVHYWNLEWYAQDNWKVNSRLTLDYGVRFYHISPYVDKANTMAFFDPSKYSFTSAPTLNADGTYTCASAGCTDGVYSNGLVQAGKNGVAQNTYTTDWLQMAPRLGFALDLFGNGKTAIRGGFGTFANRETGNLFIGNPGPGSNMSGQTPTVSNTSVTWGTLSNLASASAVASSPTSVYSWSGKTDESTVYNGSLGVQQNLGHSFVGALTYVGSWGRNQPLTQTTTYNLNPVPLWSCFGCNARGGSGSNYNMLRKYLGYTDVRMQEFYGYNNYNSLQATLQRRFSSGLMVGAAYSLSRQLSLAVDDTLLSTAENKQRNYGGGPASSNLMINYAYDFPKFSTKLGNSTGAKLVGIAADNWEVSGITHFASGSAYTVSCTANGYDATGSPDESYACDQISNPKTGRGKMQFNPAAFSMPVAGTLGNAGQKYLVGPGVDNWNVALRRLIPLGADSHRKIKLEANVTNVFNHPQFTSVNSSLVFGCSGTVTSGLDGGCSSGWALSSPEGTTGAPNSSNVGVYGLSTQTPRMMSFSARIEF